MVVMASPAEIRESNPVFLAYDQKHDFALRSSGDAFRAWQSTQPLWVRLAVSDPTSDIARAGVQESAGLVKKSWEGLKHARAACIKAESGQDRPQLSLGERIIGPAHLFIYLAKRHEALRVCATATQQRLKALEAQP